MNGRCIRLLEVLNANLSVNITADGRVLNVGGGFVPGLGGEQVNVLPTVSPLLTASEALARVGQALGLTSAVETSLVSGLAGGPARATMLTNTELSLDPIPAELNYVATSQGVELAWDLVVRTPDEQHWYDVGIGASSGEYLFASDWVDEASYNVYALPTESPSDGSRTLATDPNDVAASPYGWHDANGVSGAEYTDTRGNNVFAQEDRDANDTGGFRPDGTTSLTFDFPLDLSRTPSTYQSAAITNLFYWNNILHDVHYRYGFDEVSGNFQVMNYSGQGLGNDPVQADAQDGSGSNNANFATPPDGSSPRMQMFTFTYTSPGRDGDLDDMIIVHEYGHGVSNRLVGGPSNVNALTARQSGGMGEGWGDWWGLMFTQKPSDTKMAAYPVGTYVLGQSPTGSGIRRYPYSFDKTIDPLTYGAYNGSHEVHDSGEIWCSALWDMSWLLIDKHGYSSDIAHGYDPATPGRNGGNNLALKLVEDSLKLMPVNPSFLNGRDAILQADQVLTGGANQAEIWTAFARRGMGFSAYDGGSGNATTVIEAFDMPSPDPAVLLHSPTGSTLLPISAMDFTFNEPMNPGSFAVADDVVTFTGPASVDLKGQITGFTWVNSTKLRIQFNSQSTEGTYTMVIGPHILAADNGNPMDQDRDGVLGESVQDRYTAAFTGVTMLSQRLFAVPANSSNTIVALDPVTGAEIRRFNAPESVSSGPDGLAFDGHGLFFLNGFGTDKLWELDPDTGAVRDSDLITTGGGSYDALACLNGKVYVSNYSSNQIYEFDPVSDTITRTLSLSVDIAGGLAGIRNPDALIATVNAGTSIAEIDPATGSVTATFSPGLSGTYGAAVVDGQVYLGQSAGGLIKVYSRAGILQRTVGPLPYSFSALGGDDVGGGGAPGGIQGTTWDDLDGDGVQDAGESGLPGWTIYVDLDHDSAFDAGLEPSDVTDSLGEYDMGGLPAGTYVVAEVPQAGWRQTYPAAAQNLLVNGDFETGNFSGWTLENSGSGTFVINNGTFDPASPDGPRPAYHGAYSALTDQTGSGIHAIYQDVVLPVGTGPIELNWVDQIRNHAGQFVDPSQEYRVEVRNTANQVLQTVFSTNPGDPTMTDWVTRTADLSAFAGQTVRIALVEQDSLYYFNVHVDDVSVHSGSSPAGHGTHTVTLSPGQVATGVNFGNQPELPGEIHGAKWDDLDGDAARDTGEPGLPGWTIYLDTDRDGQVDAGEPSTVTAGDGTYAFLNLPPATYVVAEVMQGGWAQTFPGTTFGLSSAEAVSEAGEYVRGAHTPAYVSGSLIAGPYSTSPTAYRINPTTGAVLGTLALPGSGYLTALGGDGVVAAAGAHVITLNPGQVATGIDFGNHALDLTPPVVTGVELNDRSGRGVSSIDPSGIGVRYIDVTFSEPVSFAAAGVTVQKVTFDGGVESSGITLTPTSITGTGTKSLRTVTLQSNDVSELTVPLTVTIQAGQTSAAFDVVIADDADLDWIQQAAVTATAAGYRNGTDTIRVHDNETATLTVTLPASAAEGDGVLAGQGLVTASSAPVRDITVNLASNDTTEATVPATVVIPAGQTSAAFDVTIIDDAVIDGAKTPTVTARVEDWTDGSSSIQVLDDEPRYLIVALPAQAAEGAGVVAGTVTIPTICETALTVSLSSSDTTEATVPATVTILAGQTSASFNVTIVDDTAIDGTQVAAVTAHVENWTDGSDSMDVLDNENLNLMVALPAQYYENQGVQTAAGSVSISGTLPADLVVTLVSSDTTELTVPATATILAGQTSATFNLTLVDDAEYDGVQAVTVTGSAAGFVDGSDVMNVADDDVHQYLVSSISSPETGGTPFSVTLTAKDINGSTITVFTGTAGLSAAGSTGSLPVTPATTTAFVSGVWTGNVTVNAVDTGVVLTASDGAGHTGTSNAFDVVVGPLTHFHWDTISGPQTVGVPFTTTITAKDANDYTVTGFAGTVALSGWGGTGTASTIVITECFMGTPDFIEIQNVSGQTVNTSGWVVAVSDSYSIINSVNTTYWSLPTTLAAGQTLYKSDSSSDNYWGSNIYWSSGSSGWAIILDASGGVVDFVPWGWSSSSIASMNPSINGHTVSIGGQWSGNGVASSGTGSIQRQGSQDHDTLTDFTWVSSTSKGSQNAGLTVPFTGGVMPVTITPTASGDFTNGVWIGQVTVTQEATGMYLKADGGSGHIGASNTFNVAYLGNLSVSVPENATEGDGVLTGQGTVTVPQAPAADLVVTLASNDMTELTVPATVTILAGQTSAPFDLTVVDDALLDGIQNATITATSVSYRTGSDTIRIHDNETAVLAVALPPSATEGSGVLTGAGTVTVSAAPTVNVTVNLTSSDTTEVTISAGQTSAAFNLTLVNDAEYDGVQAVTVTGSAAGFVDGSDVMDVGDDEVHHFAIGTISSPKTANDDSGYTGTSNSFTVAANSVSFTDIGAVLLPLANAPLIL